MTFRCSLLTIENKLFINIVTAELVTQWGPVLTEDLKEIRMRKSAIRCCSQN